MSLWIGLLLAAQPTAGQAVVGGMSLAELRECARLQAAVDAGSARLAATDKTLAAQGAAIRAQSDGIDAARRQVNVRDAKAVATFNARLQASNARIASFRQASEAREAQRRAANLNVAAANIQCGNRPYDSALLDQLRPEEVAVLSRRASNVSIPVAPGIDAAVAASPAADPPAAPALVRVGRPAGASAALPSRAEVTRAAEAGDPAAQTRLGMALVAGNGVPRDVPGGVKWLERAAATNHGEALFALSRLYEEGRDLPGDKARARELLDRAAAAGSSDAQHNLALVLRDQGGRRAGEQAVALMTKAAIQGDPESQYVLSQMLLSGDGGRRDPAAALDWRQRAADQGYADAQFALARQLEDGDGMPKDLIAALKYYRLAARPDAVGGCARLLVRAGTVRDKATAAADRIAASLPAADVERAAQAVARWQPAAGSRTVGGCPVLAG